MFTDYRIKKWRQELKRLSEQTGKDFNSVCEYIGAEMSLPPGFYRKLPKIRETYIAIGMAYKLSVEDINKWITFYSGKRALYIKDLLEDLIWIYLINSNCNNFEYGKNYYSEFQNVRNRIEELYNELWEQDINESIDTEDLQDDFKYILYDEEYFALKRFVSENIDSFKTAYAKPRMLLDEYVSNILRTKNECDRIDNKRYTLNTLRGDLDDSMINYLAGSSETINVYDKVKGCRTAGIKHIPKGKKAHIALCLALGMTNNEIDAYLRLMGYNTLDYNDKNESLLINILKNWDEMHPLQKRYKKKYIKKEANEILSKREEILAVNEMLQLRRDCKVIYEEEIFNIEGKREKFPYIND